MRESSLLNPGSQSSHRLTVGSPGSSLVPLLNRGQWENLNQRFTLDLTPSVRTWMPSANAFYILAQQQEILACQVSAKTADAEGIEDA